MSHSSIVGLIPAAGLASRLQPLPCSKELFPVGFEKHPQSQEPHPKVVSSYLLEHMQRSGAEQVYFILRQGKWDIPAYYGGSFNKLNLGYLIMERPYGTPFSLDQAFSFVRDRQIVFGFPDILVEPENAFELLLQRQDKTKSDVVLGAFKVEFPNKWDMVELEENGQVRRVVPKPAESDLTYAWSIACWSSRFTKFMHDYLEQVYQQMQKVKQEKELSVGEVIQAAIENGLLVQSVFFDQGSCLDVGTPEDLRKAIQKFT